MTRIGIIGLGEIGGNLAAFLVSSGHRVCGFDTDPAAGERAASAGVAIARTRTQLAQRSEIAVTSLADLDAIEQTYFAADGLVALHRPGLVTIECSTVPTALARSITAARGKSGGAAIEASVIGVGRDARAGQLYFLVAGEPSSIEAARPFLDAAGRGWQATGSSGSASITKLLNNGVGAATLCAIAEAMALAARHGIAPDALVTAMREGNGAGASVVLDRHGPFMAGALSAGEDARAFNPIALKDARGLGELLGETDRAALPVLARMVEAYERELAGSTIAAPERLARAAHSRLEGETP